MLDINCYSLLLSKCELGEKGREGRAREDDCCLCKGERPES